MNDIASIEPRAFIAPPEPGAPAFPEYGVNQYGTGGIKVTLPNHSRETAVAWARTHLAIFEDVLANIASAQPGMSSMSPQTSETQVIYAFTDFTHDSVYDAFVKKNADKIGKYNNLRSKQIAMKKAFSTDKLEVALTIATTGRMVKEGLMDEQDAKESLIQNCDMGEQQAAQTLRKSVALASGKQVGT